MTRNKIITTIFVIGLAAGVTLWGAQAQRTKRIMSEQNTPRERLRPTSTEIPEHIFYGQVFSLLVKLKNTGDYQRQAALSDHEVEILEEIASECERDVAKQDAKAEVFSKAFRQKLTRTNPRKQRMPVPAELTQLQEGRDAIVLRHRDRLRKALGEDAFKRFTEAAKSIVHVTLQPVL